jgi:hypothetical protein
MSFVRGAMAQTLTQRLGDNWIVDFAGMSEATMPCFMNFHLPTFWQRSNLSVIQTQRKILANVIGFSSGQEPI